MKIQVSKDTPDILLNAAKSIPNQNKTVLATYDKATNTGIYFNDIRNILYVNLLLNFSTA